ncbi:hypothetical protein FACS1894111_10370 [Clostridia bacterium]|nr:hypothetical protein FACS1894111_10370 [Clostridia bacterium]
MTLTETTEPLYVPYTAAGQSAFDVILEIATKMCNRAKAETADFVAANFPKSKTVEEHHDNGKYSRIIKTPKGTRRTITITYDYRTKAIETY